MTNIRREVERIIDTNPPIRNCLGRGVVNIRGLAKFIVENYPINASMDAIISAIRRYEYKDKEVSIKKVYSLIGKATLTSRNSIVSITLEKSVNVEQYLPKILSVISMVKNEVFRVIQANTAIKVVIDKKNLENVLGTLPEKSVKRVEEGLAEITIQLDPESWKMPGVVAVISSELAMNNVNIREIMSCIPEIIIFFDEKDLLRAYQLIHTLAGGGQ